MYSDPIFQCGAGDLIRVKLPSSIPKIAIFLFEVIVLAVGRRNKKFVITVLLRPFSKGYGEFIHDYETGKWTLLIHRKGRYQDALPVEHISVID